MYFNSYHIREPFQVFNICVRIFRVDLPLYKLQNRKENDGFTTYQHVETTKDFERSSRFLSRKASGQEVIDYSSSSIVCYHGYQLMQFPIDRAHTTTL